MLGVKKKRGGFGAPAPDTNVAPAAPRASAGSPSDIAARVDFSAFEEAAVAEARQTNQIILVDKNLIDPDPDQPRRHFDTESLAELAQNIQSVGQLQPVVAKQVGDRYQLVYGERRWRAIKLLESVSHVELVIRNDLSLLTKLLMQISENDQRQNTTPMETAESYGQLRQLVGTARRVAELIGKDESLVSMALALLDAPTELRALATNGTIRDLTTVNRLQRLHKANPEEASRLILAIETGELKDKGVRSAVTGSLAKEKSKAKPGSAGASKVSRIAAVTHTWVEIGGNAVLQIDGARGKYEIGFQVSLEVLAESLQRKGVML